MSSFSTIKQKIVDIVDANALISEVQNYDKPAFETTPAATVVPSGNEAEYATTAHNNRMYAFTVTIYVPADAQGISDAEATLVEIIDSLIDDFDQNFTLTGTVLKMTAAPSAWGYDQREQLYRFATINLKCMTRFDVT